MSDSRPDAGDTGDAGAGRQESSLTPAQRESLRRILRELAEHDGDYHWQGDPEAVNAARLILKESPVLPIDTPIPGLLRELRRHGDDYHHRSDPATWQRALSAADLERDAFSYETLLEERRSRPDPVEYQDPFHNPLRKRRSEDRDAASPEEPDAEPGDRREFSFRPSFGTTVVRTLLALCLLAAFLAGAPYPGIPGILHLLAVAALMALLAEAFRPSR